MIFACEEALIIYTSNETDIYQASCSINCIFAFPNMAMYISFFFVLFCWFHMICLIILYHGKKEILTYLLIVSEFFSFYRVLHSTWRMGSTKKIPINVESLETTIEIKIKTLDSQTYTLRVDKQVIL